MKKATINLYDFNELGDRARRKAIEDHREFLLSFIEVDDFISGDAEYDTPENLLETYKQEYEHCSNNDEPIIESIEMNEYMFFHNGDLASVTTYTGGAKAGTTELIFCNETYKL